MTGNAENARRRIIERYGPLALAAVQRGEARPVAVDLLTGQVEVEPIVVESLADVAAERRRRWDETMAAIKRADERDRKIAEALLKGETSADLADYSVRKRLDVSVVKGVDKQARTVHAIISTESTDRVGDVIKQDGWVIDGFMKNPVVLWNHDYSRPPIGKCINLVVRDGRLEAVTKFADSEFGREIFSLYEGGHLSAFSVGFRPIEWIPPKNGKGYCYTKSELLEYSCVPVPANADAVA